MKRTRLLTDANRLAVKQALKLKRFDVFLSPVIENGITVKLHYRDGMLDKTAFTDAQKAILKRSGVPLCIYDKKRNRLGGFQFEQSRVDGRILPFEGSKYFVAENIAVRGFNPFSMNMRLSLMANRGFLTTYKLCSYLYVGELNPSQVEEELQRRLTQTRLVADGTMRNIWDSSVLYQGAQESPVSGSMVIGLNINVVERVPVYGYITKEGKRKSFEVDRNFATL